MYAFLKVAGFHFATLCRKHFHERSAELQIPRHDVLGRDQPSLRDSVSHLQGLTYGLNRPRKIRDRAGKKYLRG
jgi:hypothetical protein